MSPGLSAHQLRVEQRRIAVWNLSNEGLSARAIAKRLGVHHKTVSMDRAAGVEVPPKMREPMPIRDRIWKHIRVDPLAGCWEWTGNVGSNGYAFIGVHYAEGCVNSCAHRVSYEAYIGPIPDRYDLDHLCHTNSDCAGGRSCLHRRCVNPEHLEPVTRYENVRRAVQQRRAS